MTSGEASVTLRFAYNLFFPQHPKGELSGFKNWTKMTKPARRPTSIV